MKPQEIGIDHEALEQFKWNLDSALQVVSKVLMRRGMFEGTVSAKVDIKVQEIQKQDGEIVRIMCLEPDVKLKVGNKDRFKCNKVGALYAQIDGNNAVIVGDNQISMEEYMKEKEGA